jgi:hypothetical protein
MADRTPLAGHADSDLELRLIDLGPGLYPTTPDLAPRVRRRLESELADSTLTPLPATRSAGTRPVGDRRGGTERLPSPLGAGRRAGDEGQSWGGGVRARTAWLIAAILLCSSRRRGTRLPTASVSKAC